MSGEFWDEDLYWNRRKPVTFKDWEFVLSQSHERVLRSHGICQRARESNMPHWFRCRVNRTFQERKRRYQRIIRTIERMNVNLLDAIFGRTNPSEEKKAEVE